MCLAEKIVKLSAAALWVDLLKVLNHDWVLTSALNI